MFEIPFFFYTEFGREITYRHIQVLMFCRESGRGTGQIFWRPSNRWTFCWSQPSAGEAAPLSTSSTRLSRDRNQRSCEFQTALGAWIFLFLLFFPRQNPGASLPDSCRHSGWDRGDLLQLSWEWPLKWLCNYFKTFWMTFELICKNVQALRMTCGICVKILKPWERKFCVKI